jgi:DNA-binding HxlR family transcriptional regulator
MANKKITSTNAMNRDFLEDRCTLNKVLRIIGKRWVAEVLVLIRNDVRRFSQLKECLAGISDNVLSTVLSELVKEGLIEKQIFGEIPVRVEYKVTGKGRELTDLMSTLCNWGKKHIPFDVRMKPLRRAAAAL